MASRSARRPPASTTTRPSEERGLDGPPKSIEEFADYARQLTYTRDDGTKVQGFAYEAQNYSNVVNIARAWGGAFITPDYKCVADQPAMIKALAMLPASTRTACWRAISPPPRRRT